MCERYRKPQSTNQPCDIVAPASPSEYYDKQRSDDEQTMDISSGLYKDYVPTSTGKMTPNMLEGQFSVWREKYFDLELLQAPMVNESKRLSKVLTLTDEQALALDTSYYNLEDPAEDVRLQTKSVIYENILLAVRTNISTVMSGRLIVMKEYHEVRRLYNSLFSVEYDRNRSSMGTTDKSREAWFNLKYPALSEIKQMYEDFLAEFDMEIERLNSYWQITSRAIAAYTLDAESQNALGKYKDTANVYR